MPPPTILLVDDDAANRRLLHAQLAAEGYATVDGVDGVDALAVLEREPIDAILSDVFMPRMDGFQLCLHVRTHPRLASLPVVLHSAAFESADAALLARQVGADASLRKPVGGEVLAGVLRAALGEPARPRPSIDVAAMTRYGRSVVARLELGGRSAVALRELEWMLTRRAPTDAGGAEIHAQPYGDLTALNTERTILDAVGPELLRDIVGDYLNLLETSSAVYEKNGDYAFGIFSSGWCRAMDLASFRGAGASDAAEALRGGAWHCHESCWNEASRPSMASGEPVDVGCAGGIRLYAVPIRAGDEIVGSINFGYGAPPGEDRELSPLAEKFRLPLAEVRGNAVAYPARPAFILALAKQRLQASARLIGEIVLRHRAQEEAKRLNAALEGEVAVRTEQLRATIDELEAFAYTVSHDLRAPLRAIDGFSRILVTEHLAELSPAAREHLETVRASSQDMGHLIDDLLGFARLGRQALRVERVAVEGIVRHCLEVLGVPAEGRDVALTLGDLPDCDGDPGLLRVVWMNLLSNALKYSRARHRRRIEVGHRADGAYFVRDNGVGFDMAYAGKLFGVFQRLHRAEDYEGTGVGLATAQRIVHRHGGRIWAEAAPELGATFFFTLPPARTR